MVKQALYVLRTDVMNLCLWQKEEDCLIVSVGQPTAIEDIVWSRFAQ